MSAAQPSRSPPSALHATAASLATPPAPRPVDRFGFFLDEGAATPAPTPDELRLDNSRTTKWLKMLADWPAYRTQHPSQLKSRVRKGVPNALRCRVWPLLCGSATFKAEHPGLFQAMLLRTPARVDMTCIALDLPRTYPHHVLFSPSRGVRHEGPASSLPVEASMSRGQRGLRDVLRAYACYDPRVGYCQGMAFVAGMLLSFMPAEDTFFMLVALMKDPLYGLAEMYAPGLLRFHEVMAVFGRLVAEHAPRLAAHFGALGVEYAMFASQWFITLFTYSFPFDIVTRAWDLFLAEGWKAVFRVAVAVLKLREAALLAMEFDDLMPALKALTDGLAAADVIDAALRVPLTRVQLAEMLAEYRRDHAEEIAEREKSALRDAQRKEALLLEAAAAGGGGSSQQTNDHRISEAGTIAVLAMAAPSPLGGDEGEGAAGSGSAYPAVRGSGTGAGGTGVGAQPEAARDAPPQPAERGASQGAEASGAGGSQGGGGPDAAASPAASVGREASSKVPQPPGRRRPAHAHQRALSDFKAPPSGVPSPPPVVARSVSVTDRGAPPVAPVSHHHSYAPIAPLPVALLDACPPPDSSTVVVMQPPPLPPRASSGAMPVDVDDDAPAPQRQVVHAMVDVGVPVYLVTPDVEVTIAVAAEAGLLWPVEEHVASAAHPHALPQPPQRPRPASAASAAARRRSVQLMIPAEGKGGAAPRTPRASQRGAATPSPRPTDDDFYRSSSSSGSEGRAQRGGGRRWLGPDLHSQQQQQQHPAAAVARGASPAGAAAAAAGAAAQRPSAAPPHLPAAEPRGARQSLPGGSQHQQAQQQQVPQQRAPRGSAAAALEDAAAPPGVAPSAQARPATAQPQARPAVRVAAPTLLHPAPPPATPAHSFAQTSPRSVDSRGGGGGSRAALAGAPAAGPSRPSGAHGEAVRRGSSGPADSAPMQARPSPAASAAARTGGGAAAGPGAAGYAQRHSKERRRRLGGEGGGGSGRDSVSSGAPHSGRASTAGSAASGPAAPPPEAGGSSSPTGPGAAAAAASRQQQRPASALAPRLSPGDQQQIGGGLTGGPRPVRAH